MHKYKHAARYSAWYDDEEDRVNGSSKYNPFRKINPRRRRQSGDPEAGNGLTHVRSEGDVISPVEQNRRSQLSEGITPPNHADTMPSQSTTNEETPDVKAEDKEAELTNGNGTHTTNGYATHGEDSMEAREAREAREIDEENAGPRKRKGLSKFLPHKKDKEEEDGLKKTTTKGSGKKQNFTVGSQLRASLFNSWINILLIAAPVGIGLNYAGVNKIIVFVVNFIAIIPLAALLSYATEEIALRTGEVLGGLLNATFGNAVELIVSIIALFQNQILVVQTSLIGSMLSNLLLVMGMCFFFGGVNRIEQHFNVTVAQTASSLLALAIGSLIIPTAFVEWGDAGDDGIVPLSRGVSVILLFVYACYLLFQLKSHSAMYNEPSKKVEKRKRKGKVDDGAFSHALAHMGAGAASQGGEAARQNTPSKEEEEEEREEPQLHFWVAVGLLLLSTVFVALCAEFMVDSIDALTETGGISKTFVGLILLPIVGNAAEHATAVTVAIKDKMDLAIGVAVGSSMQIALLVIPFIVIVGWCAGKDDMNLEFDGFQIAILFVAVLLVNYLIQDGKSHWLEGVLLMTLYIIIAVAAWFYPTVNADGTPATTRRLRRSAPLPQMGGYPGMG